MVKTLQYYHKLINFIEQSNKLKWGTQMTALACRDAEGYECLWFS